MAVKDHSLDDKIKRAAKNEFMKYGYQKASLHKIAENAGTTTGALYTRYKNKDDLFCSLIDDAVKKFLAQGGPLREMYYNAREKNKVEDLIEAIKQEEAVYLNIMFKYYDECVLFFCKSGGSSIEDLIENLMKKKVVETIDFLKKMTDKDLDYSGIEFIICEQTNFFRLILEKGYSKEKAIVCMETVEAFLAAGWKNFFENIM